MTNTSTTITPEMIDTKSFENFGNVPIDELIQWLNDMKGEGNTSIEFTATIDWSTIDEITIQAVR